MTEETKKLNPQQIKFVREYIRTGNAKQSALTAGYSESYADQITTRLVNGKSEIVRRTMHEILEKQGLTREYLAENLKSDIDAKPANRKGELELLAKLWSVLSENKTDFNVFANGPVTFSWQT